MIALGKEAISVLIAAEETAGRNFANGLGMGGFISFPVEGGPDESQAQNTVDRLKKDFSALRTRASSRSSSTAVSGRR